MTDDCCWRGNNGTGKSKVLALTLPFLLDGDLSPRRVEPDGDPGKRMEWNLLLGGEHPHTERLGYTWIEFGRLDASTGESHFRTLLCGLKAVSGRGIARHWYAVTDLRVQHGPGTPVEGCLSLVDATGTALTRDRLVEAVADHGMVYDQAKTYRRAVDEALFGLGEQRYGALVDLLVQLRQPQLSKRPNEAALSRALTEALPPVDQAVIADVAEAFRSLDEEKTELAAASAAEHAAAGFLEHYRRYARVRHPPSRPAATRRALPLRATPTRPHRGAGPAGRGRGGAAGGSRPHREVGGAAEPAPRAGRGPAGEPRDAQRQKSGAGAPRGGAHGACGRARGQRPGPGGAAARQGTPAARRRREPAAGRRRASPEHLPAGGRGRGDRPGRPPGGRAAGRRTRPERTAWSRRGVRGTGSPCARPCDGPGPYRSAHLGGAAHACRPAGRSRYGPVRGR
ncbi:hypothetical protein SMICM304S_07295 [Streptomyces microflavus]